MDQLVGRPAKPIAAKIVGPLTERDLKVLAEPRGTQPQALKKISFRHRTIAKLLATGTPQGAVAAAVGMTKSRISILSRDPMMVELIVYYQDHADEILLDYKEKLTELGEEAIDELRDRLEDPETRGKLTERQLMDIITLTSDRTGHGPQSKTDANVNINVGMAERMQAARERVAKLDKPAPIDAEYTEVSDGG